MIRNIKYRLEIFFFIVIGSLFVAGCAYQGKYGKTIRGDYKISKQVNIIPSLGKKGIIKGCVKDKVDGNVIPYANVYVSNSNSGTSTDSLGFFKLTLPSGKYRIIAEYVGNSKLETKTLQLNSQTEIEILLFLGIRIIY